MNISQLTVDPHQLHEMGVSITKKSHQLQDMLGDLKSRIQPAIDQWEGSTGSNYTAAQHKWNTSADDLQSILEDLGGTVKRVADDFLNTELNNAKMFN